MSRQLRAEKKEDAVPKVNRRAAISAGAAHGMVWLLAEGLAVLLIVLVAVFLFLDRANVRLPFAADYLAERLSQTLDGQQIKIASLSFELARSDRFAGVTAYGVELVDGNNKVLLQVPEVEVKFTLLDLLKGEIKPERVEIIGAEVFLRKTSNGLFKLSLGKDAIAIDTSAEVGRRDLNDYVSGSEFLRDIPELAKLAEVAIRDAAVNYRDDLSDRFWRIDAGELVLQSLPSGYSAAIAGELVQENGRGAQVNITAKQDVTSGGSHIVAEFSRATPRDLADQFPALDWMRVLDAPVSGTLAMDVQPDGTLVAFGGGLNIGQGAVMQGDLAVAAFRAATTEFSYDPTRQILDVNKFSIASDVANLEGVGHVFLEFANERRVDSLVVQMRLRNLLLRPPGGFVGDLPFADGRVAVKVSMQPFAVDIGEIAVFDAASSMNGSGFVRVDDGKLAYALDVNAKGLGYDDVLAFWPGALAPKARDWVVQNIQAGKVTKIVAAFRSAEAKPKMLMQFQFGEVAARFLKFMPVVQQASGFGEMNEESFIINVVEGTVDVANKGPVSMAGTRIVFPHYRVKPAPAVIELAVEGEFPAIFDLINRAPLSLLDRAGIDDAIATGRAKVAAILRFPLKKNLPLAEINAEVQAELVAVGSDRVVKGRFAEAETLTFAAKDGVMSISGDALLDALPVRFEWLRRYGVGVSRDSKLSGSIPLSDAVLADFGFALPQGSVSGQSSGELVVDIVPGQASAFALQADLGPLDLRIPALGWSKPAGTSGTLHIAGALGEPIALGSLAIDAPGLVANGRLDLSEGKLRGAEFENISVGGWLDAKVSYAPGKATISGGSIDLRNRSGARGSGATAVTLDGTDIQVTDTIELAGAVGQIQSGQSLQGNFQALVNGGTMVDVALRPDESGQRISVTGVDAGAILRDAGLFRSARGGDLKLTMVQTGGPGEYRGAFEIHNVRVKDAPVLAALLSAASIIGFLEQLDGNGLAFMTVSGNFTMKDGILTLVRSKAVGASMGISLEGRYQLASKSFDMNGVISPLYAINGIFEKLPIVGRLLGGKDGEGLIGFSYLLRGSAQAPKISVNPLSILTPGALREIFEPQRPAVPAQ